MCIVRIANNINRNVYMHLNTRIFPTTGYARVLLFMFIRRELGGMVQDVYFSLHTVNIKKFFWSNCPLQVLAFKTCNQDISKTITASSFKLRHLIEDNT